MKSLDSFDICNPNYIHYINTRTLGQRGRESCLHKSRKVPNFSQKVPIRFIVAEGFKASRGLQSIAGGTLKLVALLPDAKAPRIITYIITGFYIFLNSYRAFLHY